MIHLNATGKSFLTRADIAALERGENPGDDGSGRAFAILDETRLVCIVPTEANPIELGWIGDGESVAEGETAAVDLGQEILELRALLADRDETIDRLMVQRDEAIARLAESADDLLDGPASDGPASDPPDED